MFRYGGAETGEAASQFDVFRMILVSKTKLMRGLFADLPEAAYLDLLAIHDFERTSPLSIDDNRRVLDVEGALQSFQGIISKDDPKPGYWVTTTAFLGELGQQDAHLGKEMINIRLRVSAREYENLNDTYTLAILYALYMDSRRVGKSRQLQAAFLEQARRVTADMKKKGDLHGDVKLIDFAVQSALGASKGP